MPERPNIGKTLEDTRDALRSLEGSVFAESARQLAEAAQILQEVHTEQQRAMPQMWMDHERCAAYLDCSPEALYRMVRNGEIPAHKIGGRNRYNRREVDAAALQK